MCAHNTLAKTVYFETIDFRYTKEISAKTNELVTPKLTKNKVFQIAVHQKIICLFYLFILFSLTYNFN